MKTAEPASVTAGSLDGLAGGPRRRAPTPLASRERSGKRAPPCAALANVLERAVTDLAAEGARPAGGAHAARAARAREEERFEEPRLPRRGGHAKKNHTQIGPSTVILVRKYVFLFLFYMLDMLADLKFNN